MPTLSYCFISVLYKEIQILCPREVMEQFFVDLTSLSLISNAFEHYLHATFGYLFFSFREVITRAWGCLNWVIPL